MPATGASSRRTERFAVSISASLTAGLMTSVDMGKEKKQTDFKKNHGFSTRCPAFFFFQKLNMSACGCCVALPRGVMGLSAVCGIS